MVADLSPLKRTSTGLTSAHRELIGLLAQIAVEDFLAESEPNSMTEAPADERKAGPA